MVLKIFEIQTLSGNLVRKKYPGQAKVANSLKFVISTIILDFKT